MSASAADPNVRTFTVDRKYLKVSVKQPVAMRRSRGGGEAEPVPVIAIAPPPPQSLASQTRVSEVIQTAGNAVAASPDALTVRTIPAPVMAGGSAGGATKVILGSKKKRTKVLLSHKRHRQPVVQVPAAAGQQQKKTRKITIKLQGLKRRITKARKTARMSRTLPLDHIRKELVNRKLLKANSKAPEGMIRQMYTDAKIVANKSL